MSTRPSPVLAAPVPTLYGLHPWADAGHRSGDFSACQAGIKQGDS